MIYFTDDPEIIAEIKKSEEREKNYEDRLEALKNKIGLTEDEAEEKEWLEDYFVEKSRMEEEMYFANGCR